MTPTQSLIAKLEERLRQYGDGLPNGLLLMREAADRIEQLEDSTPWQPRTTAPVETMILLAGAFDNPTDFRIKVGYFSETKNDWVIFGASWKPTHWRHLPKPPRGKH